MNIEYPVLLSVVGLGKLGLCLATGLADAGFSVLGYDIDEHLISLVSQQKSPFFEPLLQDLLLQSKDRLCVTTHAHDVIAHSSVTFIVVPTPSQDDGAFSDKFIRAFFSSVVHDIHKKTDHHTFVIVSTVMPNTSARLISWLENQTGKKLNTDFSICYKPEFIALGSIITDMKSPDLVLIGESQQKAGELVEQIYRKFCVNTPRIARMSIVSAEITKIALNAYVTMKISFANTLGNICEHIPGAQVDAISTALGADKRITPFYLKAGCSFGGPCFPRDNKAFTLFAQSHGVDARLSQAVDYINDTQVDLLVEKIEQEITRYAHPSISFLGLSYKTNTPVVEESMALRTITRLLVRYPNMQINVYDPLATRFAQDMLQEKVVYHDSLKSCLTSSSLWVVATAEPEFLTITEYIPEHPIALIDHWRLLPQEKMPPQTRYYPVGVHITYD